MNTLTLITTAILAGTSAGLAAAWLVVKLHKPLATGGYVPAGEPYVIGESRSPAFPRLTGFPSYIDGGLIGGNKEGGAA